MTDRKFVKFCGITNLRDALSAEQSGCDAIGFVFVKKSKRYIEPANCQEIISKMSPMVMKVALFADNSVEEIKEVLKTCGINVLQFHGYETPEFCEQFKQPFWKAIPMADDVNPLDYADKYSKADAFLLDNFGKNQSGGSGEKFSWDDIPELDSHKWILAGGLNPENIKQACNLSGLNYFDVSSGIEESPGVKSQKLMNEFIKNLND